MILKYLKTNTKVINDQDKLLRTPLHWAVKRSYEKVVEILVDYGADVTIKDYLGRTSRDLALEKENTTIVKVSRSSLIIKQFLKKVEKGRYVASKEKYQNTLYVKNLLPLNMMDEFNKFLGHPSLVSEGLNFLFN